MYASRYHGGDDGGVTVRSLSDRNMAWSYGVEFNLIVDNGDRKT